MDGILKLNQITLQEWMEFYNSLTTEKETWSLDRNVILPRTGDSPANAEEYYEVYEDGSLSYSFISLRIIDEVYLAISIPVLN